MILIGEHVYSFKTTSLRLCVCVSVPDESNVDLTWVRRVGEGEVVPGPEVELFHVMSF